MPFSVYTKLGLPALQSTQMTLELANCSLCVPKGIARDVLVPVGRLTFPADFVVVDFECDYRSIVIMGCMESDSFKPDGRQDKESIHMMDIYDDRFKDVCEPESNDSSSPTSTIVEEFDSLVGEIIKQKEEVKKISDPVARRRACFTSNLENFRIIHQGRVIHSPQIASVGAISHIFPNNNLEDSFKMGDEDLNFIPNKELDKEDLIPIPRESKIGKECDFPLCDDFQSFKTFSNPFFEKKDDFPSRNDESILKEEVHKETLKSYLNPLFEDDEEIISIEVSRQISSKVNSEPSIESPISSSPSISSSEASEYSLDDFDNDDDLFEMDSNNDEWKRILYGEDFERMDSDSDKTKDFDKSSSSVFKSLSDEFEPSGSSYVEGNDLVCYEDFHVSDVLFSTINEDKVFNPGILVDKNSKVQQSNVFKNNTIPNPRNECKGITTRSGVVLDGPLPPMPPPYVNPDNEKAKETEVTKDKVQPESSQSTANVQPRVDHGKGKDKLKDNEKGMNEKEKDDEVRDSVFEEILIDKEEFFLPKSPPIKPNKPTKTLPYPSRVEYEKKGENDKVQIQKFWEMFKKIHVNITLADALILMPKYQKMLKSLLSNKEKLNEMANTPVSENCSAIILKKLPEKLEDPGQFLIPCTFSELKCKALADLGASINLMPFSVYTKLGLPALQSTRMTLELANCSLCVPKGIARDVLVPVGRLTFPADFVVVDFECDYRVPLILGRPFLRTARTLIDVFGEEMSLRTDEERLIISVRSEELKYTTRPHKESVCMIDIFSSPKEKDEDPNAIFTSSEVVKCDFLTTNGDPITPPSTIPTKEDLTNEKVEKHEVKTCNLSKEISSICPSIKERLNFWKNKEVLEKNEILKRNKFQTRIRQRSLIQSLRESKIGKECDFPFCDDFQNFKTFSNPLFEKKDDFPSRNDESILKEEVHKETLKSYLNPLFEDDEEIISIEVSRQISPKVNSEPSIESPISSS
ncbi:reverse transcriptase domain-containing protein [Tanacetum coccineum]